MLAGALMGLSSIWIFVRTSLDVEFHTLMSRWRFVACIIQLYHWCDDKSFFLHLLSFV
jgi:hypothetical protein